MMKDIESLKRGKIDNLGIEAVEKSKGIKPSKRKQIGNLGT